MLFHVNPKPLLMIANANTNMLPQPMPPPPPPQQQQQQQQQQHQIHIILYDCSLALLPFVSSTLAPSLPLLQNVDGTHSARLGFEFMKHAQKNPEMMQDVRA